MPQEGRRHPARRACFRRRPPAAERIYTAGEKEHEIRLARKAGVPINDSVQKEIIAIRDELGLNQYHFPFED